MSTEVVQAKGPAVGLRNEGLSRAIRNLRAISSYSEQTDKSGPDRQPRNGLLPRAGL